MNMTVMIQVSEIDEVKDPSEGFDSCISQPFHECLGTISRLKQTSKTLFVRWFIEHADGTESHHGDNGS